MAAFDRVSNALAAPFAAIGPYSHAEAVVTSDTVDLVNTSRALYFGGAGAAVVITAGGETVTISGIPVGTTIPIRVTRVKLTGTTATLMVAFS